LHQAALHNQCVGWVERSDTHQSRRRDMMGIAALNPSYTPHYPNNPFPGT